MAHTVKSTYNAQMAASIGLWNEVLFCSCQKLYLLTELRSFEVSLVICSTSFGYVVPTSYRQGT